MIVGQAKCPACKTANPVPAPVPKSLACSQCGASIRLVSQASLRKRRLAVAGVTAFFLLSLLALTICVVAIISRLRKTETARVGVPSSSSPVASSNRQPSASSESIAIAIPVAPSIESKERVSGIVTVPASSSPPAVSAGGSGSLSVAAGSSAAPSSSSGKLVLDRHGNPVGDNYSLGKPGEYKGKRILFWCGSKIVMDRLFNEENPLWKALAERGFEVTRKSGVLQEAWLKDCDQFWICSSPELTALDPTLVSVLKELLTSDDLIKLSIEASSANKFPVTADAIADVRAEYRGLFEVTDGPPRVTAKGYDAIVRFIESGKGVFIMAENDPYYAEANVLLRRLYKTSIKGNYPGEKILYVRERNMSRETIAKYKGEYEIRDHPLLTGVNFIFEGITISHVDPCDKLQIVFTASDGQILCAVSAVKGHRIVIDCGYTHYYYGKSELYRPILRAGGTVRFAENVAAYLQGKE